MALDWSRVRSEHVRTASEIIAANQKRDVQRGLIVKYQGATLPAKDVLRLAYRIANALSEDERVIFASGESTLKVLRRLGFDAERLKIDG